MPHATLLQSLVKFAFEAVEKDQSRQMSVQISTGLGNRHHLISKLVVILVVNGFLYVLRVDDL
jgi:hypothetical protein